MIVLATIVSAFINFVSASVLALLVILRRRYTKLTLGFIAFSISIAFWSLCYFLWQISNTAEDALLWSRFLMFFASFIPVSYLMFIVCFMNKYDSYKGRLLLSLVLFCGFALVSILTPYIVTSVEPRSVYAHWPVPGVLFFPFLSIWILYVLFPAYSLLRYYFSTTGVVHEQAKLILLGVFVGYGGGITNYLLWMNIPIPPIGNILVSFFVFCMAYAISKHRLMDVRLAIRKIIANLLVTLGVFLLFTVNYYLYLNIYEDELSSPVFIFFVIVAVIIVFSFDGLQKMIRRVTDRFLFSAIYDQNKLMRDLGGVLSSTLGFEDVMPKIYEVLSRAMHIKYINFGLRLTGRKDIPSELIGTKGDFAMYYFGEGEPLGALPTYFQGALPADHKALLYDDLAYMDESAMDRNTLRVKQWMNEKQVGVILPLYIKEDVIGYLILGEKLNGDAFTSEDVAVLETFALQAAIGIENILLFMYMRDFNTQLKTSVEKATSQLKEKNRTLELLRKMDSIITTSLDLQNVCQKIVDTLSWELGYDIAYVSIVDTKAGVLRPVAVAHTPVADKAAAIVSGYEHSFEVPINFYDHPLVKVLKEGVQYKSSSIVDVVGAKVPENVLQQLESMHTIGGVMAFPVYAKEKVIGVLVVAVPVDPNKLTEIELELLGEFVKEVGIALDNALLYEEVKRTNQALIDTNKRLIDLDRMKDEFVSIASHELRTPMTAINSYVWMALNKGGEMSDKAKDYLGKVAISTQRLIDLVNDMLNVSRIESGRVEVKKEPFDIVELIKDVHEELQIKANERHLELAFEYTGASVKAVGDANKTREVLTNFLGNSLKFTEKGKVWTSLEFKQTTVGTEIFDWVEISVRDTGRGISQDDMPRLFTKFGRLENELATIAQTQGTGLGLFICKKYVEAMGGEVGADSELGKGSRFWFRLKKAIAA